LQHRLLVLRANRGEWEALILENPEEIKALGEKLCPRLICMDEDQTWWEARISFAQATTIEGLNGRDWQPLNMFHGLPTGKLLSLSLTTSARRTRCA